MVVMVVSSKNHTCPVGVASECEVAHAQVTNGQTNNSNTHLCCAVLRCVFAPRVLLLLDVENRCATKQTGCNLAGASTAQPVQLPIQCNVLNSTSQVILDATRTYAHANAACYAAFRSCEKNATQNSCTASCNVGESVLARACAQGSGHFCIAR